jgi:hypothetical protein
VDYNKILKKLIREQINTLDNQRYALEINKDFRKIPLSLKETYYYGYGVAMDSLYEILNDAEKGSYVSFEDYQNVSEIVSTIEEYLISVLDAYGIKYEVL